MLTKLLILAISLAHIAYADKSSSCSKGPSYWCESVQNAKECHAFSHCLDSVWSKHSTYTQSKSDDSFLTQTNTPNQCGNCVQCVLNNVRRCPMVHEFENDVEKMRSSGVTPTAICRLLKQCAPQSSQQQDTDLSQMLIGQEDAKINRHFKCGLHPRNWCDSIEQAKRCDAVAQCIKYSWTNMAQVYKVKEPTGSSAEVFDHDQKSCSFCVYVFDKLETFLQSNVEVNVKQYLQSACALLPSKDKSNECVKSVNEYFDEIDQLVTKKLSPTVICKLLKVCEDKFIDDGAKPSQADLEQIESIPKILKEAKVRLVDSDETKLTKTDSLDNKVKIRVVSDESKARSDKLREETMGVGCELCQIVFHAAKYLLENKVDHQRIFKFVEKELCYRLGNMNQTCVDYIEQEGELLLHLIEKQVDPSAVCHQMGLCLNVQVEWQPTASSTDLKFYDLNVRNDLNCTLCKMVLLQVKLMLNDKKSEQKILDYINQNLCARTGRSKETCRTLIDAYGPVILHLISQDIHPDQLCDMIGMCKKKSCHDESDEQVIAIEMIELTPAKSVDKEAADQVKNNNVECVLCEFAMSLLAKELSQNETEPQLEALMNKVCNKIMPSQLRPQCSNFVQQYGPIIIQLLINKVEPTKICTAISVCPGVAKIDNKFVDSEHIYHNRQKEWARKEEELNQKIDHMKAGVEIANKVGNNTLECSLCVYVGELVEKALSQNKTEEQITAEMKLVCNLFPVQLRDQCNAFVDEYAPYILKLIITEVDPHQACTALKLCDQIPKESRRNLLRRWRF